MDPFGESIYEYETGKIKLIAFWCKWISGDFNLKVHSRIVWVDHNELDLYDFASADIPLMRKLKSIMN
jgi:8-oxo-dGTP diphosphatase